MTDPTIKRLMEQVGMPNSRSLYQAFKQLALELELECASREAAALEQAALIAEEHAADYIADEIRALIPKDSGGSQ